MVALTAVDMAQDVGPLDIVRDRSWPFRLWDR
jgi:hypothetical protein